MRDALVVAIPQRESGFWACDHLVAMNVPLAIPVVVTTSATPCSNLSFHLLNLQAPCALRPNRKRFGSGWHPIQASTRAPVATVGPYTAHPIALPEAVASPANDESTRRRKSTGRRSIDATPYVSHTRHVRA